MDIACKLCKHWSVQQRYILDIGIEVQSKSITNSNPWLKKKQIWQLHVDIQHCSLNLHFDSCLLSTHSVWVFFSIEWAHISMWTNSSFYDLQMGNAAVLSLKYQLLDFYMGSIVTLVFLLLVNNHRMACLRPTPKWVPSKWIGPPWKRGTF